MKQLTVTRIDIRSTRENPISPETIVIDSSNVASIVDKHLDKYHNLIFAEIPSSFSGELCNGTCENVDCD